MRHSLYSFIKQDQAVNQLCVVLLAIPWFTVLFQLDVSNFGIVLVRSNSQGKGGTKGELMNWTEPKGCEHEDSVRQGVQFL